MKTIVIAPHPDDEILGVGGTLLRRKSEGAKLAWIIVTTIDSKTSLSDSGIKKRETEINQINKLYGFDAVFELGFPAAKLDQVPLASLVSGIANAFKSFKPNEVFLPHSSDIHSDHRIVFEAVASCTKWFRHPSINRVLAYETLSETDFGLNKSHSFNPNVFVDIEAYLDSKLNAMGIYESEMAPFPFPRSQDAIRALAILRGAASGFRAAEAFELLRERF
jgi:LmbE family N-acetylglucosaminyl deacetylase